MAKINWTEKAIEWLQEIHDYIAENNPVAANNTINDLYNKVQMLREYPKLGHYYRIIPTGEIRILLYGHYRIGYLIKNNGSIDILGIFHDAMEIDNYLSQTLLEISDPGIFSIFCSFYHNQRSKGEMSVHPSGDSMSPGGGRVCREGGHPLLCCS